MDYGIDISTDPDLDFDVLVSGEDAVKEAVLRCLSDSREAIDIRDFLNANLQDSDCGRIAQDIQRVLTLDERVLEASCSVSLVASDEMLVEIQVRLADGIFKMVVKSTALTVSIWG